MGDESLNVEELGNATVEIGESRSQIHVSEPESLGFVSGIVQCRN
jgi:hypothetical protein